MSKNKLLIPIYIVFFVILFIGSIGHLMFGSCQSSKYHYIVQCYWMPAYLPESMLTSKKKGFLGLEVYDKYSGIWKTWHQNGNINCILNLVDGKPVGECVGWHGNGNMKFRMIWRNGELIVFDEWDEAGRAEK